LQNVPKWQSRIFLGFALGGLVFVAGCFIAGLDDLIDAFSIFKWQYFAAALLLALLNYLARYVKFDYYLRLLDIKLSWREGLSIFLSGLVLTITPGKLGEALKSFLIKDVTGVPVARTAPIVIAERLTDFIAMLILSLGGILTIKYYGIRVLGVSVLVLAIFFVIIGVPAISYRIFAFIGSFRRLKIVEEKLHVAYDSTLIMIGIRPLIIATLISIPAWFFECFAFYLVIKGFSFDISIMYATCVYAVSTIAGALSMLPGGLGPTEIGLAGLIDYKINSMDVAIASTFIVRIATLWFAILVGAIALILRHQRFSELDLILENVENEATDKIEGETQEGGLDV